MKKLKKTVKLLSCVVVVAVLGILSYKTYDAHLAAKQINFMNSRAYPPVDYDHM